MKTRYRPGDAKSMCDRCGVAYYYSMIRADGESPELRVCPRCWDPAHPGTKPIHISGNEGRTLPNARARGPITTASGSEDDL